MTTWSRREGRLHDYTTEVVKMKEQLLKKFEEVFGDTKEQRFILHREE